jgi:hypothetical protein
MPTNTIPRLINAVRPNLPTVAKWSRRSVWVARLWQQGAYQPMANDRIRLVKAVRKHAKELLLLAAQVEREGRRPRGGK